MEFEEIIFFRYMEVSSTEYNTLAFHYETFGFYVSIDIRKDAKQFFPQ